MIAVVEHPESRIIVLKFKDGKEANIKADKICEPDESNDAYRLKLERQIVAKYNKDIVDGWHLQNKPEVAMLTR